MLLCLGGFFFCCCCFCLTCLLDVYYGFEFCGVCFVDVCLFLCLFLLLLLTWSEAGHQGGEGSIIRIFLWKSYCCCCYKHECSHTWPWLKKLPRPSVPNAVLQNILFQRPLHLSCLRLSLPSFSGLADPSYPLSHILWGASLKILSI